MPTSGRQDEFIAEGGRDGATRFEQGFQMSFGSFLEAQDSLTAVAPVRVTTGEKLGLGDPDAVLILADMDFADGHDHDRTKIDLSCCGVNSLATASLAHFCGETFRVRLRDLS